MQGRIGILTKGFGEWAHLPTDFATIDRECPRCGGVVPLTAATCRECGSRVGYSWPSFATAGALGLLFVAIVVASATVLRWQQLTAATATGAPADELFRTTSITDFSWLSTAMSGCDAVAKADPGSLHFLVTPLAIVDKDPTPWRAKSINSKDDGILLRAGDALDGLKQASLRIYPTDYVFSLTDEVSKAVYRWRAATGVARFSNADAAAVSSFTIQFFTFRGTAGTWGSSFGRQDGSCYWVNPVIGG